MTRDDAAKLWPIIKAWSEGKTVEFKSCHDKWVDVIDSLGGSPSFDAGHALYRIKPEPVECWGLVSEEGAVIQSYRDKSSADRHLATVYGSSYRVVLLREVED